MDRRPEASIAILGLGLMGGSLGLALTRAGLKVSGWDANPEAIKEAFKSGAICQVAESLGEAVRGASVIFIATPVASIPEVIQGCLSFAAPGSIFTDLGSIKEQVIDAVFAILPASHFFVAGHPMTGSERQGMAAADPFLFQNAAYIVIDDPRTPAPALAQVVKLIKLTGAHVLQLTAAAHDRTVALVSHLPHLIAATLAKAAGMAEEANPGTLALAAGGFRDTTRVATGNPQLWEGIINGNREWVLEAIALFEQQLQQLKAILIHGQTAELNQFLAQACEVRLQIPAKNKGFLTLLHEMVVTIEDRPGAIVEVLSFLGTKGINIKDIEILRIREGDGGTLKLSLEDSVAVDRAVVILEGHGFKVWKR